MINPLVSIIIPVYNAEKYIEEAIKSAINQTWANKEIIIVDDGSTDNSVAIAKQFESESVKVLTQQNKGASAARNKGLAEASGDYIQFLDADDILGIDKIEKQLKILIADPGKIAVCKTVYFFENEDPYSQFPPPDEHLFLYDTDNPVEFLINLYGGNDNIASMIQTSVWLCPKNVIDKAGKWNEELTVDDDGEFFCRVVLQSDGIRYAENANCYYRKYKNNASLSTVKGYNANKSLLLAVTLKLQHLQQKTTSPLVNKAIARTLMEHLVIFYPAHKDLYTTGDILLKKLGGTDYIPIIGGKQLELLKKILGWKAARMLSYYFNYFKQK